VPASTRTSTAWLTDALAPLLASALAATTVSVRIGFPNALFLPDGTPNAAEPGRNAAFGGHQPLRVHLGCAWPEIERRTLARGDRTLAEARHGYENGVVPSVHHHHFDTTRRHSQEIAVELAQLLLSLPTRAA